MEEAEWRVSEDLPGKASNWFTACFPPFDVFLSFTIVLVPLIGSISSSSSISSLEHKQSLSKNLNARGNNKKTMSKSPSLSSRASAGIYGFFNQAFLVFFILVCL